MQGWLTLLCVQLMVFIAVLAWGWHCHQQRLSLQKKLLNRLQQQFQHAQQQLVAHRQQLADALLDLQTLKSKPEQAFIPAFNPVSSPMPDSNDYDKIRQLFKQGISPMLVQDSFNLSRSELEILVSLQKTAA